MNRSIYSSLRLLALSIPLLAVPASAKTIVFTGPQDAQGRDCVAGANHCIIGELELYRMFSASLTSPDSPGGQWRLNLQTNYPTALPGTNEAVPVARFGSTNAYFAMCDFMIEWDNKYYGIVLHAHDVDRNALPYVAGSLYQVDGFQASGPIMAAQGQTSPRPYLPALINAGGTLLGTGTVTASQNAGVTDPANSPLYTVIVDFNAPANFLQTGNFTIHACSYVCDNGYITGTNTFYTPPPPPPPPPPPTPEVPEPSTYAMVAIGVAAVVVSQARSRK